MQFVSYPELFRAYPGHFKMELSYIPALGEAMPPILQRSNLVQSGASSTQQNSYAIQLPSVFTHIVAVQFEIWFSSGFGDYSIQNEWVTSTKHRICLKACPSHVYHLTAQELDPIKRWCEQVNHQLSQM
jgi:hypothetical protein